MRLIQVALILCLCSSLASAYTFVFKTGKKIEGTIHFEDSITIRIIDSTGVAMSLNRNSLDWKATQAANAVVKSVEPASLPAENATVPEVRPVRLRTTAPSARKVKPDIKNYPEKYWKDLLNKAKKDYSRFQQDCRNAGVRTGNERLQTNEYRINGKTVKVTGYWADPDNIRSANDVCKKALKAQTDLMEASYQLETLLQKNESSPASTSADVSSINK